MKGEADLLQVIVADLALSGGAAFVERLDRGRGSRSGAAATWDRWRSSRPAGLRAGGNGVVGRLFGFLFADAEPVHHEDAAAQKQQASRDQSDQRGWSQPLGFLLARPFGLLPRALVRFFLLIVFIRLFACRLLLGPRLLVFLIVVEHHVRLDRRNRCGLLGRRNRIVHRLEAGIGHRYRDHHRCLTLRTLDRLTGRGIRRVQTGIATGAYDGDGHENTGWSRMGTSRVRIPTVAKREAFDFLEFAP